MKTHEHILDGCKRDLVLIADEYKQKSLTGAIAGLDSVIADLSKLRSDTQKALDAHRRLIKTKAIR